MPQVSEIFNLRINLCLIQEDQSERIVEFSTTILSKDPIKYASFTLSKSRCYINSHSVCEGISKDLVKRILLTLTRAKDMKLPSLGSTKCDLQRMFLLSSVIEYI